MNYFLELYKEWKYVFIKASKLFSLSHELDVSVNFASLDQ